jgi:holo-[acyl-carrier protein] synthase
VAVIGIGVDVVDVTRLARVLDRTPSMAERVFLDAERAYAGGADSDVALRRLAARFAAKEAAAKALGTEGTVRWREIEVISEHGERPVLRITGHTAHLAEQAGIRHWHLSISHDGNLAMAVVVVES